MNDVVAMALLDYGVVLVKGIADRSTAVHDRLHALRRDVLQESNNLNCIRAIPKQSRGYHHPEQYCCILATFCRWYCTCSWHHSRLRLFLLLSHHFPSSTVVLRAC